MRYTHSTDIECPVCEREIRVMGTISKYAGDRETPPEYEVEEVDVTACPDCGADVTDTAFDAVADTDEGPEYDYDGPDTQEEYDDDRF